jgi:hypothetical protein
MIITRGERSAVSCSSDPVPSAAVVLFSAHGLRAPQGPDCRLHYEHVDGTGASAGEAGLDSVLATKAGTASGEGETAALCCCR